MARAAASTAARASTPTPSPMTTASRPPARTEEEVALEVRAGDERAVAELQRHYMIQPLVELYGGCMAVLKVS